MTNAPERIWIDDARTYSATFFSAGIPYVRADLFDAMTAERDDALALVAAAYEAAIDEVVERLFVPFTAQARYVAKHKFAMIHDLTATYASADAIAAQSARDERMRAEGAAKAEARIARLEEAANALVDFHNAPLECKRSDMFQRLISRLAAALQENSDE